MFQHVRQTESKTLEREHKVLVLVLCVNFLLFEIHILREQ